MITRTDPGDHDPDVGDHDADLGDHDGPIRVVTMLRSEWSRWAETRRGAKDAIDRSKPYRGGNEVLWRLHKLNNLDKHRLLLTVGSAFRAVDLGAELSRIMREAFPDVREFPSMKLFFRPADKLFPLKVGDELYIGGVDHPINPDMEFRFDVALGEPGIVDGEPLIDTLQQMVDVVDALVAEFRPHLVR